MVVGSQITILRSEFLLHYKVKYSYPYLGTITILQCYKIDIKELSLKYILIIKNIQLLKILFFIICSKSQSFIILQKIRRMFSNKSLKLVGLLILLIISAHSKMSYIFLVRTPVTIDNITCAKNKGYLDEAFISGELQQPGKLYTTVGLRQAYQVIGRQPHLVLHIANYGFNIPANQLAEKYANAIQNSPAAIVWLFVNSLTKVSCDYLINLTEKFISLTSKRIGILSSFQVWELVFGSRNSCPYFGRFPLYYGQYDGKKLPFEPFGGWTYPDLITSRQTDDIGCGFNLLVTTVS